MYSLGVDIGTSKVACSVYDSKNHKSVFTASENHNASIEGLGEGKSEQSVAKIIETTISTIKIIPEEMKKAIACIGVTGQMHGVILFTEKRGNEILINWQDKRASFSHKLEEIQKKKNCSNLKDGYGFTTLACSNLSNVKKCGTIHDYFVALLTNSDSILTDPTDADSWGLYDIKNMKWDEEALESLSINKSILPKIVPSGTVAGNLCDEWAEKLGIKQRIPVTVAIGDNQASVLGTGRNIQEEMFITIGTGTQLSFVVPYKKLEEFKHLNIGFRPFPGGKVLAVSAPLCGGQAWKFLSEAVVYWGRDLGVEIAENKSYEIIDTLGLKEFESNDLPVFNPHFLGERWDPSLRASITGIELNNFSIGKLSAALAKGIIRNLRSSIPSEMFSHITKIVASGNGIRKSKVIQKAVEYEFGLKPSFTDSQEEAACGAAILSESNFNNQKNIKIM